MAVQPPVRRGLMVSRVWLQVVAVVVLFGFLFGGRYLLHLLQLKQESVSIAGGIVLFLIGVRMIFPPQHGMTAG